MTSAPGCNDRAGEDEPTTELIIRQIDFLWKIYHLTTSIIVILSWKNFQYLQCIRLMENVHSPSFQVNMTL